LSAFSLTLVTAVNTSPQGRQNEIQQHFTCQYRQASEFLYIDAFIYYTSILAAQLYRRFATPVPTIFSTHCSADLRLLGSDAFISRTGRITSTLLMFRGRCTFGASSDCLREPLFESAFDSFANARATPP